MSIERMGASSNLIEVLDRVLDKGIVVDAWIRLSLVGIELVTVEARIVVASIATYLGYGGILSGPARTATVARQPSITTVAARRPFLQPGHHHQQIVVRPTKLARAGRDRTRGDQRRGRHVSRP